MLIIQSEWLLGASEILQWQKSPCTGTNNSITVQSVGHSSPLWSPHSHLGWCQAAWSPTISDHRSSLDGTEQMLASDRLVWTHSGWASRYPHLDLLSNCLHSWSEPKGYWWRTSAKRTHRTDRCRTNGPFWIECWLMHWLWYALYRRCLCDRWRTSMLVRLLLLTCDRPMPWAQPCWRLPCMPKLDKCTDGGKSLLTQTSAIISYIIQTLQTLLPPLQSLSIDLKSLLYLPPTKYCMHGGINGQV